MAMYIQSLNILIMKSYTNQNFNGFTTRQERREWVKEKEYKRSKKFVHHHIKNRCRGGSNELSNLILLEEQREKAWHFLFGNLSFKEAAALLNRVMHFKDRRWNL